MPSKPGCSTILSPVKRPSSPAPRLRWHERCSRSGGSPIRWVSSGCGLREERRQTMQPLGDVRASAVVLAGGRSSRMGTSKALLLFDGEPLIVHVVATLKRLFDDVVVVASPGQDLPSMPVTLVRDEVAYQGPVGGLCYGLKAATQEICFVTACDSAFLSPALISHLVDRSAAWDVVVPHWQGRFQPLHAVYRRSVLPLLEAQLARGELRPVSLFDRVRTLRIDEEEVRRFDSDGWSFFNMNSPADYEQALERWRAIHSGRRAPGDESITC